MIEHISMIEIEKEILGMLFVSKESAKRIIEDLDETYFYEDIHRKLFLAAKHFIDQDKYFDLTLICDYLKWEDSFEIAEIHHHGISDANYDIYYERLREEYIKRKVKNFANDDFDIKHISEIMDEITLNIQKSNGNIAEINIRNLEEYIHNSDYNTFSPGWVSFAEHYKISKGQVTIITGIPSHGKSAFIDQIAMNLVDTYDFKIRYFSPENLPVEKHILKIIRMRYGNTDKADEAIGWIKKHYTFIDLDPERRTLNNILSDLDNVDLFVIDPWNELESQRPKDITETEYIGNALKTIKAKAVRHNCHIIIAAHPTKLQRNEKGNYPVPRPYDISGSANWLNKADICFSVYRILKNNILSNETEIHIQKVRFQPENGQLGMVKFKYNNFRFEEMF